MATNAGRVGKDVDAGNTCIVEGIQRSIKPSRLGQKVILYGSFLTMALLHSSTAIKKGLITMHYHSTRGGIAPINFTQAVMMGLATDGGLILPIDIPHISPTTLTTWSQLTFQDLALEVMAPFVGESIPSADLRTLIERAFSSFRHPEIVPLVPVGDRFVLELFHGPTLAFKDIALQFLGELFEYILDQSGEYLNILGATSGDTGSAAIDGVRGKKRINIVILHPHGKVSPFQERQMTSVMDDNVFNIALRGSFDDAQAIVKELFNDLPFKERYHLGAVNSINWARVMAQITYYFYAWGRVSKGDPSYQATFSIPTGNFGDIFAGYLAKKMGLPIKTLILATNSNDILARFIHSGEYALSPQGVQATISPSMDIQVASNFERYLYDLLNGPEALKAFMNIFQKEGHASVSKEQWTLVQEIFSAQAISEEQTLKTIGDVYQQQHYLLDPHAAVGFAAAEPGSICLATAHPAKFSASVKAATGEKPVAPQKFKDLFERPHRCALLDADLHKVKAYMKSVLS